MEQRLYVSTTRDGRSRPGVGGAEVAFAVPSPGSVGGAGLPTAPTSASGSRIELRTADGLLDDLGERIFLAEAVGAGTPEGGPVTAVASARLLAETAWDDEAAARFALECAEHALGDRGDVVLPHGHTLQGVLADVRSALEQAEQPGPALGWLARLATARRLRRDGVAVGDLAALAAKEDESSGVDVLDDPAWTGLAAISEAVLATAEVLDYLAHPHHVAVREDLDARDTKGTPPAAPPILETPWGPVFPGGERIPGHRAAASCAQQAAERARQSVADVDGEEAGRVERGWQASHLEAILAGGAATS